MKDAKMNYANASAPTHLASAVNYATTGYLAIMGIYPKWNGATCASTALNSGSCTSWGPKDGGIYFVSTRTDITDRDFRGGKHLRN